MTKEEALKKLEEFQKEEEELNAEERNLHHVKSLVVSDISSRADEHAGICQRMWSMLQARWADFNRRLDEFERELQFNLAGYTA